MIGNLRATTERNTEQDWLKTNLAQFSRMMQGQRDLRDGRPAAAVGTCAAGQCAAGNHLTSWTSGDGGACTSSSSPATPMTLREPRAASLRHRRGTGRAVPLPTASACCSPIFRAGSRSRCAAVCSARGRAASSCCRCCTKGTSKAVVELASLGGFTASHLAFLEQLTGSIIGVVLNTIEATMRTGEAASSSPSSSPAELQAQQTELQQTNEELANKAQTARRAERRGRAQESGNRARAPRARREGDRARVDVALQVRVPAPTCRTSCARRSTASSSSASSWRRTPTAT